MALWRARLPISAIDAMDRDGVSRQCCGPFSHLVDAVSAHLDESSVRFLLGMLVSENLIAIRHSSSAER